MKQYRYNFKQYLSDLAAKKPAPGGGSVAALEFCLASGLIEKALVFSGKQNCQLAKACKAARKKVFPYIDLDAKFFSQAMETRGTVRKTWIKKSENLVVDLAKNCLKLLKLAKITREGIKKNIVSDFNSGCDLLKLVVKTCCHNLEANEVMLKRIK